MIYSYYPFSEYSVVIDGSVFVNSAMEKLGIPFELKLNGVTMQVYELTIPKYTAFRIVFSSMRKPLVVTRTRDADKEFFWTSIPEGRQKEAEGVGNLIEEYFKSKEKS